MILFQRFDPGCASLEILDKYLNEPFLELLEKFRSNRFDDRPLRPTLSVDRFRELLFENCTDCEKMAALPQAAFATSKVRCNQERDNGMISMIERKEKANKEYTYDDRFYPTGWELTPLKYNSKLMNSIWGLYNRYSVHNFKKNTDADEGLLQRIWRKVSSNPSSVVSASVVTASTTVKTPFQ